MNQKIVFLDIDGTLADRNRIPSSARRACREARKNGHLLYICTGRPLIQISSQILKMGFDGVVSSGGACIETANTDKVRKILFQASFEEKTVRRLLDYLNAGKTPYMVELSDKVLAGPYLKPWLERVYTSRSWNLRMFMEKLFMRFFFRRLVAGEPSAEEDVCKVVFMESGGPTFEDIKREFGDECELFRNSIPIQNMKGGEISPRGIHKGAALEKVAAYHGIAREDTIALGDSDNDRTMLECAGVGIAMGNADEALKQRADDVTDTLENHGLAKAFKKYGLLGT
ncbi:MAG: Cof-type HAD-IIB family hydrolase [Spirochaetaceae bacterium]|jgi:Cof subfamily protein (haloacid dehalogenase superfamily)|nr:Cof-type HAD-IIB family hydrolase [Spirochaetaceae bacterium]